MTPVEVVMEAIHENGMDGKISGKDKARLLKNYRLDTMTEGRKFAKWQLTQAIETLALSKLSNGYVKPPEERKTP